MLNPVSFIYALVLVAVVSCASSYSNHEKITGYNLLRPDNSFTLPDTLREISGLTDIDSATVACIQDENGIMFIYDVVQNKLTSQYPFGVDGDYEGISRVGSTMYILRSDGTLLEIADYKKAQSPISTYDTGIPANNNEGLCYDPAHKRLLIASKGKIGKGPAYKNKRVIYGFDLKSKKLSQEPAFEFDIEVIKTFAIQNNIGLPTKSRKKKGETVTEPILKFMTSAIAIHPISNQLFLLSASDYLLFVFNTNGEIEYIEKLHPEIFKKAEGITFLDNGDLLITNEGENGWATMLRFNYLR
ncbi:MAG: hypothetical protein KDC83_13180 [Flavobacteriales bacterium]|nr:hypothetical protein [Flavobacteriales bacterium]